MNNTLILGSIICMILIVTAVIGINAEINKRKELSKGSLNGKSLNRK